jgi:hypothetical protein
MLKLTVHRLHSVPSHQHFPSEGWRRGEITAVKWINSQLQYIYEVNYSQEGEKEWMPEERVGDIIDADEVDDSLYSFEVFNNLWEKLDPERVEKSSLIRKANTFFEDKETGAKYNAQYGRMMPGSTDMLFQIMQLRRDDIYLDIGHGIGNSCFQAAYTRGCEARGIEIVQSRHDACLRFQQGLEDLALERDALNGKVCHLSSLQCWVYLQIQQNSNDYVFRFRCTVDSTCG